MPIKLIYLEAVKIVQFLHLRDHFLFCVLIKMSYKRMEGTLLQAYTSIFYVDKGQVGLQKMRPAMDGN